MKFILYTLFVLALNNANAQNCWTAGNGSDGAFHATIDTSIVSGVYNYSSFTIDAGATVTVTGTTQLEIYCNGTAQIDGTLTVSGVAGSNGITSSAAGIGAIGIAGGGNGGDGSYSASLGGLTASPGANTGGGGAGTAWTGGGGAGHAFDGADSGGSGGFGGTMYGTSDLTSIFGGSGGGGGSGGYSCGGGGGGAGGGVIILFSDVLNISATGIISADGGAGGSDGTGNCGGGAGGSGGSVYLASPTLTVDGLVSALGGAGGASTVAGSPYYGTGGAGSGGRIRIDYATLNGTASITPAPYVGTVQPNNYSQALTICSTDSLIVGSNVYNTTGIYIDTLQTTQGCDSIITSNLTVLPTNSSSQSFDICMGDTVYVGMNMYTASGTYTDNFIGSNSCDSTVTTTVSVTDLDNTLSASGTTLTANETSASYQWIDCDNGNIAIAGATSQSYTPTVTGNYAVEVSSNNCSVTSSCILVDFTGINELELKTKTLVRITDFTGRETTFKPNTPLIYIYDDGSVERIIRIQE